MNHAQHMNSRFSKSAGFTLVEITIASFIGMAMIGMAVLTSVNLFKDLAAANAYRDIHENARRSLAMLSRDLRASIGVTGTNAVDLNMTAIGTDGTTNTI